MAGNLWGADVAQLRTLAQQFGKTSETLLQQSTTLTSAINGNTAWKGADGARFKSDWNGSHRALIHSDVKRAPSAPFQDVLPLMADVRVVDCCSSVSDVLPNCCASVRSWATSAPHKFPAIAATPLLPASA